MTSQEQDVITHGSVWGICVAYTSHLLVTQQPPALLNQLLWYYSACAQESLNNDPKAQEQWFLYLYYRIIQLIITTVTLSWSLTEFYDKLNFIISTHACMCVCIEKTQCAQDSVPSAVPGFCRRSQNIVLKDKRNN